MHLCNDVHQSPDHSLTVPVLTVACNLAQKHIFGQTVTRGETISEGGVFPASLLNSVSNGQLSTCNLPAPGAPLMQTSAAVTTSSAGGLQGEKKQQLAAHASVSTIIMEDTGLAYIQNKAFQFEGER